MTRLAGGWIEMHHIVSNLTHAFQMLNQRCSINLQVQLRPVFMLVEIRMYSPRSKVRHGVHTIDVKLIPRSEDFIA
jgi:hypothetical protein